MIRKAEQCDGFLVDGVHDIEKVGLIRAEDAYIAIQKEGTIHFTMDHMNTKLYSPKEDTIKALCLTEELAKQIHRESLLNEKIRLEACLDIINKKLKK